MNPYDQPLVSEYEHAHQQPGVLLQPNVYRQMGRGINKVINAVRPTLGPNPRLTAIETHSRQEPPELLDDAGTIARRLIELPNQHENVGAMLVRGMLWRLHEQSGDGTATAAVLFQTIYNEGVRYIASGGNAMLLRKHLEGGLKSLVEFLELQTVPISDNQMLSQIAKTVCDDEHIAIALGEAFEIIGEHGLLDIQSGHGREPYVKYFEGNYWSGGIHTNATDSPNQAIELVDASIVLTDFALEDPAQVVPILRVALQAKIQSLVIVARSVSSKVVGLLKQSEASARMRVFAVKTPGTTTLAQANALTDLSMLTGGRVLLEVTGDSPESMKLEDFGQARRVWMNKNYLGIKGGKGDVIQLKQHIAQLRKAHANAKKVESQTIIQKRIGRLTGGMAILYVGGVTQTEIDTRKAMAERAAQIIRKTCASGVLVGGGMSLLSCRNLLRSKLEQAISTDERAAYRILLTAVQAPFCTLAYNSGYEGGAVLAQIEQAGNGHGFDFYHGQVTDMCRAGIFDSADAQLNALKHAVKTAALALTIDAVVYRRKPEVSMLPE